MRCSQHYNREALVDLWLLLVILVGGALACLAIALGGLALLDLLEDVLEKSRRRRSRALRRAHICPQCGYDIRTSPTHCPECGMYLSADRPQIN